MAPGGTITQRALRHLYPLEIEETDEDEASDQIREDRKDEHPPDNTDEGGSEEPNREEERTQEPDLRRSKRTLKLLTPFTNLLVVMILYWIAGVDCIPVEASGKPMF